MAGNKKKLSEVFGMLKINEAIKFMRGYLSNDLTIVAYHRICDIDDVNDRELVSATVDDFDWQISYIKKHYTPLTFEQVIGQLVSGNKLPGNSVVVTFDDGFADNYLNAYPILKKHAVPATFFIATSYIGSNETFWFNFLSRMLMHRPGESFEIQSHEYQIPEDIDQRLNQVPVILDVCKQVQNIKRLEILKDIQTQLNYSDKCDILAKPMTWDNIREMCENGMEIGSHTVTHPILSQLTPEEIRVEIHDSKNEIEKQLDREIHTISYPEGMEYAFNLDVLSEVEKAGYLLGATYIPGNNYRPKINDYLLKRVHIERYVERPLFAAMLCMPELFS